MPPKRAPAIAMVILAIALTDCRAGGAQPSPSTSATCKLAPTGDVRQMTMTAPGPGNKNVPRTYELYVPTGLGQSAPLLVSLHGTGANGSIQAAATHWTQFADSHAFIAAFPDGIGTLWYWGLQHSYDVDFIYDVIGDIRSIGCIDAAHVYIDGWSEGSYMAQRMACTNGDPSVNALGISIAGVHGYAGGNPGDPTCGPQGHPARPTRVLLSQGLDDQLIDPQKVGYPAFTSWAKRYSCANPPAPFTAPQRANECDAGATVAWWPIVGQGHLEWSCAQDQLWHDRGVWSFLTLGEVPADTRCT